MLFFIHLWHLSWDVNYCTHSNLCASETFLFTDNFIAYGTIIYIMQYNPVKVRFNLLNLYIVIITINTKNNPGWLFCYPFPLSCPHLCPHYHLGTTQKSKPHNNHPIQNSPKNTSNGKLPPFTPKWIPKLKYGGLHDP